MLIQSIRIVSALGLLLAAAPAIHADTHVVMGGSGKNVGLPIQTDGDGNATANGNSFTKATGKVETTPTGTYFEGTLFGSGPIGGLKPSMKKVTSTSTALKDFSDTILAQFEAIANLPCDVLLARAKLATAMGKIGALKGHLDDAKKAKKISAKAYKKITKKMNKAAKEGAKAKKALDILTDNPPKDPVSKTILQTGAAQDLNDALEQLQAGFSLVYDVGLF